MFKGKKKSKEVLVLVLLLVFLSTNLVFAYEGQASSPVVLADLSNGIENHNEVGFYHPGGLYFWEDLQSNLIPSSYWASPSSTQVIKNSDGSVFLRINYNFSGFVLIGHWFRNLTKPEYDGTFYTTIKTVTTSEVNNKSGQSGTDGLNHNYVTIGGVKRTVSDDNIYTIDPTLRAYNFNVDIPIYSSDIGKNLKIDNLWLYLHGQCHDQPGFNVGKKYMKIRQTSAYPNGFPILAEWFN